MPIGDPTPWYNRENDIFSIKQSSINTVKTTPFLLKIEQTKPSHRKAKTMQQSIILQED